MIIGLLGKKGVGKDTCADYIVKKYQYNKYSFAQPLKEICRILFGFTDEQLYGIEKEKLDEKWNITPRLALQFVGTELFRNQLNKIIPNMDENIWINIFESNYKNNNIVIADCRFQNEVDKIKKMNGIVIKIIRDTGNTDSHISEDIDKINNFDYIIDNNSGTDILDLYNQVDKIIVSL